MEKDLSDLIFKEKVFSNNSSESNSHDENKSINIKLKPKLQLNLNFDYLNYLSNENSNKLDHYNQQPNSLSSNPKPNKTSSYVNSNRIFGAFDVACGTYKIDKVEEKIVHADKKKTIIQENSKFSHIILSKKMYQKLTEIESNVKKPINLWLSLKNLNSYLKENINELILMKQKSSTEEFFKNELNFLKIFLVEILGELILFAFKKSNYFEDYKNLVSSVKEFLNESNSSFRNAKKEVIKETVIKKKTSNLVQINSIFKDSISFDFYKALNHLNKLHFNNNFYSEIYKTFTQLEIKLKTLEEKKLIEALDLEFIKTSIFDVLTVSIFDPKKQFYVFSYKGKLNNCFDLIPKAPF